MRENFTDNFKNHLYYTYFGAVKQKNGNNC